MRHWDTRHYLRHAGKASYLTKIGNELANQKPWDFVLGLVKGRCRSVTASDMHNDSPELSLLIIRQQRGLFIGNESFSRLSLGI